MKYTNEQIIKAKKAKSVEELITFAKENGIELTEEQAKEYFAELHKEGELTDDELMSVTGGINWMKFGQYIMSHGGGSNPALNELVANIISCNWPRVAYLASQEEIKQIPIVIAAWNAS